MDARRCPGGARFANSGRRREASGLSWIGGGFRKNGVAGLILDNGAHDMTVKGAYFVRTMGRPSRPPAGITLVKESGSRTTRAPARWSADPAAASISDTFSTWGPQAPPSPDS